VRQVAAKDRQARFTALLHHVDVDRLRAAYWALQPNAAAGVDGVTWVDYGLDLEENLRGLHVRVHRGSYRAKPSRRVLIPKADGRLRPLGVAALEDKILQRALVEATHSWLNRNRAILIRWSKKDENHLALLMLARGLIAFKKAHAATLAAYRHRS
jgi:hypothetical protein